jgi:hypothetical protein
MAVSGVKQAGENDPPNASTGQPAARRMSRWLA